MIYLIPSAALAAALVASVVGQNPAPVPRLASASGRVTYGSSPLPGVTVTADALGVSVLAVTDMDGGFTLEGLPNEPLPYAVSAALPGFKTASLRVVLGSTVHTVVSEIEMCLGPLQDPPLRVLVDVAGSVEFADAVVHFEVSSQRPWEYRRGCVDFVGTQHTATVLDIVKSHAQLPSDVLRLVTFRSISAFEQGQSYIAFLHWHAEMERFYLGSGGYVVSFKDGRALRQSDPSKDVTGGLSAGDAVRALRALLRPPK